MIYEHNKCRKLLAKSYRSILGVSRTLQYGAEVVRKQLNAISGDLN